MVLPRSQCYTSVDALTAAEQQQRRIAGENLAQEPSSQVGFFRASVACLQRSAIFPAV